METRCPACDAPIDDGAFCASCGLDLAGAEASELRALLDRLGELDGQIVALFAARDEVAQELTRRRYEISAARVASAAPPRRESAPPGVAAPRVPEWSVDRVRGVLLWFGAALLATSALTFTAVAWTRLDDAGRAALLAGATVACVGAVVALRHRLPATAEAFAGLSIALAVIDWYAGRRAGLAAGVSDAASWAFGAALVAAFALALGRVAGARTCRVAVALLAPLSTELLVVTVAGAPWSIALGYALVAAAAAAVWVALADGKREFAFLGVHATFAWLAAAVYAAAAAAVGHDDLAPAATAAGVVAALALAPAVALANVRGRDGERFLAALVIGALMGALVTLAAALVGPYGLLASATVVGGIGWVAAGRFSRRFARPARVAAAAYAVPGFAWASTVAIVATIGPLAWLDDPWHASLDVPAREVIAGPNATEQLGADWPVAAMFAVALVVLAPAVSRGRRGAVAAAAMVAVAAAVTLSVIASAPARTVLVVAVACTGTALIAAAFTDRRRPRVGVALLPAAFLAGVPATGWAALTRDASRVTLGAALLAAAAATGTARSDALRAFLGALAGAAAVALAGVWVLALGHDVGAAGFAVACAAGVALLAGVHARRDVPEGLALELTGLAGLVTGGALTAGSVEWLASACTAMVPLLALGALRRGRARPYGALASAAALGATWAWLAVAHVDTVEAYSAPAAVVALGAGVLGWRSGPARSWVTLGPGVVLAVGPTLVLAVAHDDAWRALVAAALGLAAMILGGSMRLQAPLGLGAAALAVLAIDTLGPAAARLPRWIPLAVAGVLLMWIGATFESKRERARELGRYLARFG